MTDREWIAAWSRYAAAVLGGIAPLDGGTLAGDVAAAAEYADAMMEEHEKRVTLMEDEEE